MRCYVYHFQFGCSHHFFFSHHLQDHHHHQHHHEDHLHDHHHHDHIIVIIIVIPRTSTSIVITSSGPLSSLAADLYPDSNRHLPRTYVSDIYAKNEHGCKCISWLCLLTPPLSVDSWVGSGSCLHPIQTFLSDPRLFFAEIRAPLVAVITNSRAETTTENKSEINLTLN